MVHLLFVIRGLPWRGE